MSASIHAETKYEVTRTLTTAMTSKKRMWWRSQSASRRRNKINYEMWVLSARIETN